MRKKFASIQAVIKDYNKSFKEMDEFKKVKWSSKESMINRYKLFFRTIKKTPIKNWLDIGFGTGAIFQYHDKILTNIDNSFGLELNKNLYKLTKKKFFKKRVELYNSNVLDFNSKKRFDLISALGVMQNCGYSYKGFLSKIKKLLNKNGFLFITSKNILWNKFSEGLTPEKDHLWFNPYDVLSFLKKKNFLIKKINGFDPSTGKEKNLKESHTFYIFCRLKYDFK